MSPQFHTRLIAMDAYEAAIERSIVASPDLYDLDGETFLRNRDGRVETGSRDLTSEYG
jgi:hypothetical protein